MTFSSIRFYNPVNAVNPEKVKVIANSMREHGYVGCPILVFGESLLTGSHRLAALESIYAEDEDSELNILDWEVAEDVTEIVESALATYEDEHGYIPDIDYSDIGWIFRGTWVEKYKDDIEEW